MKLSVCYQFDYMQDLDIDYEKSNELTMVGLIKIDLFVTITNSFPNK